MKIKELKPFLYSDHGSAQLATLYDSATHNDIESGCPVDYVIREYGDGELKRLQAFENQIIITL